MAPKRAVLLSVLMGGALYVAAYGLEYANGEKGKRVANPLPKLGGVETGIAWAFLFLILYATAEVPATAELSQAFALLILLTMLFTYGVEAFTNLAVLMGWEEGISIDPESTSRGGGGSRAV